MKIGVFELRHVALVFCFVLGSLADSTHRYATYRQMVIDGVDNEIINEKIISDALARRSMANRRDPSALGPPKDEHLCEIEITAPSTEEQGDDPVIKSLVKYGDKTLHEATTQLSKLKTLKLGHGIRLFADTPYGGRAYVFITHSEKSLIIKNVTMLNLPKLSGKKSTVAPMVIDADVDIEACKIEKNVGTSTGAILIAKEAMVDIESATIYNNHGESGAMRIQDGAYVTLKESQIEANVGTIVGGVLNEGTGSTFSSVRVSYYDNIGEQSATSLLVTGEANLMVVDSLFETYKRKDDLRDFLLNKDSDISKLDSYNLPKVGAAEVNGKTTATFTRCRFNNQAAKYGSIMSSEGGVVTITGANFNGSLALNGAGVYVNGDRDSFARVSHSSFIDNVARNGGAIVGGGRSTYDFFACNFERNHAVKGGAIWGEYAEGDTNQPCIIPTDGSRITINASTFIDNHATDSGGALYIKCSDVASLRSTFTGNSAEENGGSIYVEDINDFSFTHTKFKYNKAGADGGSLFVKTSRNILLDRTVQFISNSAEIAGGAIYSADGNGISMTGTVLRNNRAILGNGGAIHTLNVDKITAEKATIIENRAGSSGGALSLNKIGELSLDDVDLTNNNAMATGGAVSVLEGKSVMLKKVKITDIEANIGSISLHDTTNILVQDIDFYDNKATDRCGALDINGAENVALSRLQFRYNVAKEQGGGLCLANAAAAEISNTTFLKNLATDGGAIIFENNKEVTLKDTQFDYNYGSLRGGAIKGDKVEKLVLKTTVMEHNGARTRGAAVYMERSSVIIDSSDVSNNYIGVERPGGEKPEEEEEEEEAMGSTVSLGFLDIEETIDVDTRLYNSEDTGGIIYSAAGKDFQSLSSTYRNNNGRPDVGGTMMLSNLVSAYIRTSVFEDSSAVVSGGCIYAKSVAKFKMEGSNLTHCEAAFGGAVLLEGQTTAEGRYNVFKNSTADSGGAILCKGASTIAMSSSLFEYNAAREGASATSDCSCDIDFESSLFYRDTELPNNGFILHANRKCSSINLNNCRLYGDKHHNGMSALQVAAIAVMVGIILCFIITVVLAVRRRRSRRRDTREDIESGRAPLIPPRRMEGRKDTVTLSEDSEEYYTETEEDDYDSTESDETESEKRTRRPTKAVAAKQNEEEYSEDDESEEITDSTDEETFIAKAKTKARAAPDKPFVTEVPEPIGVRNPKETRAAARRRQASLENINDGAGPSFASTSENVLPPVLPPKLKLNLSIDRSNPASPVMDPCIEEEPQTEEQD